jgi:hypothetical protein
MVLHNIVLHNITVMTVHNNDRVQGDIAGKGTNSKHAECIEHTV